MTVQFPIERQWYTHRAAAHPVDLIGRDQLLADLAALWADRHVRMLTLTGLPGSGKTRVAAAFGQIIATSGTVRFLSLAHLRTADQVAAAIVDASGHDTGAPFTGTLILDTFDHLIDSAWLLADLLAACPDLRIIVTSRSPTGLAWEQVVVVTPLDVPARHETTNLSLLARCPSVALYVQRATAVRPDFRLSARNATDIADLCRHLDGLPLAIDLAARRVRVLPPHLLLERFESLDAADRLRLLRNDAPDVPVRHRSLETAIAWSYDLLNEDEQRTFRLTGAFAGGASIEAAEAVCGECATFDHVARLIDATLLHPVDLCATRMRITISEPIRFFALSRLLAHGEIDSARERHARYFAELFYRTRLRFNTEDRQAILQDIDTDYRNIIVALEWSLANEPDRRCGIRIGAVLARYWCARGMLAEGRGYLARLLAPVGDDLDSFAEPEVGAETLFGAGILARVEGDYEAARAYFDSALRISRRLGNTASQAHALLNLGLVAQSQGEGTMRDVFETSAAMFRDTDDLRGLAFALNQCGMAALSENDSDSAAATLTESLNLFSRVRDPWGAAMTKRSLAALAYRQGDLALARSHLEESIEKFRHVGSVVSLVGALRLLETVLRLEGVTSSAAEIHDESEQLWKEVLGDRSLPASFLGLGSLTEPLMRSPSLLPDRAERRRPDLDLLQSSDSPYVPLSTRELEVLQLLGSGMTNPEIAEALYISLNTVKRHLANIYSKLGVGNRVEAATFAFTGRLAS